MPVHSTLFVYCIFNSIFVGGTYNRCSSVPEYWVRWKNYVTNVWARSSDGCNRTSVVTLPEKNSRSCKTRGQWIAFAIFSIKIKSYLREKGGGNTAMESRKSALRKLQKTIRLERTFPRCLETTKKVSTVFNVPQNVFVENDAYD